MNLTTFGSVWFRYSENTWDDFELKAFQDEGTLTASDGLLRFDGRIHAFEIRQFVRVSKTSQGRDFVNMWVRVDYLDGNEARVAFFNDGSILGWGGIFGGTDRLMAAISEASGLQPSGAPTPAAGWFSDPAARHELRYWDGANWTDHVSDAGIASSDPL